MKYEIFFTVEGAGEFPYDMLRFDGCYPATETSSHKLRPDRLELRGVRLTSPNREADWMPTETRWSKLGWRVITVTRYKYPDEQEAAEMAEIAAEQRRTKDQTPN